MHSTVASSAVRLRRDGVTLNFDLLTPKSNQFISVPRLTVTKVWRKSVNRYWRYRGNIKLPRESRTDARTDGQRHGRTTRKHIASAGAYRRRRLKTKVVDQTWIGNRQQMGAYHAPVNKLEQCHAEGYRNFLRHLTLCLKRLPFHYQVEHKIASEYSSGRTSSTVSELARL